MEIINNTLDDIQVTYPVSNLGELDKLLFFDIETTGFSARTSSLYLIGCLYNRDGIWKTAQFFADNYSDEQELLNEFFAFTKDFDTLIHFNGNNFDIPYILDKCEQLGISQNFDRFKGIDIYKRTKPYRNILKIENCKQKTIEQFLRIDRDDKMSGGDLIGVYHSFVSDKAPDKRELLLLHNFDDLKGMLKLLPVLAYSDLYNDHINVTKVSANYYNDENNIPRAELIMVFEISTALPIPISVALDGCFLSANGNQGTIKVPIYKGELKYFYSNYHDYYYLPAEDMAIHKSVAEFVDRNHREKAKASNCYTRKDGMFLRQFGLLVSPFFKEDYNSNVMYFELTDERKKDRELFSQYATHVLEYLAH